MTDEDQHAAIRDEIIAITTDATRRRLTPGIVTGRKDFASLGVDSVNVFEIILQLETRYSVTLTDSFLFDHCTPTAAAEALHILLSQKNAPDTSRGER